MDKRLVELSEQEVRIEFALNSKCKAKVRLRSLHHTTPVAFKVQTSSPDKFLVNPPSGLVLPLSSATFRIILRPQTHLPRAFPRSPSDRFLVKTSEFTDSFFEPINPDSVNSWFSSRPPGSTQDLKLKVAFVGPLLLRHAVSCGNCDAVRNLVKRHRSVVADLPSGEAESLLRAATDLANTNDMVHLLLEAGLRINPRLNSDNRSGQLDSRWVAGGWNKLHVAAALNQTELISTVLKATGPGALNYRDKEGRTPLHVAASKGHSICARLLVELGANVNATSKDGKTALCRAAANGHSEMVKMLIEVGADPTIKDGRGRLPVDVARDKEYGHIVKFLEF